MKTLFSIGIFLCGIFVLSQNSNKILTDYLKVKESLVVSDFKATSNSLATFSEHVKAEKSFPKKKELTQQLDKMRKASSLENQRKYFYEVSTLMWEITKDNANVSQPVYYQYCPMAKGYWLSEEKEIKNPYYGTSMLNCGKVVETKK